MLTTSPPYEAMRGSPSRNTEFMEQLQIAYVNAVCAAAGCVPSTPYIDEGIDIQVSHTHKDHSSIPEHKARLELQLKSTSSPPRDGLISATMSAQRFEEFSIPKPSVNRLVVIMAMPPEQKLWVHAQEERLAIHHCAYWVNLAGHTYHGGKSVTVKAPTSQVFDDLALCRIMELIGRGERP